MNSLALCLRPSSSSSSSSQLQRSDILILTARDIIVVHAPCSLRCLPTDALKATRLLTVDRISVTNEMTSTTTGAQRQDLQIEDIVLQTDDAVLHTVNLSRAGIMS